MKKLFMTAALAALIASPAAATYTEIPVPEIDVSGDDSNIVALLVVLGIAAFILLREDEQEDLSTPRPTVRPQNCMGKLGQMVACD